MQDCKYPNSVPPVHHPFPLPPLALVALHKGGKGHTAVRQRALQLHSRFLAKEEDVELFVARRLGLLAATLASARTKGQGMESPLTSKNLYRVLLEYLVSS